MTAISEPMLDIGPTPINSLRMQQSEYSSMLQQIALFQDHTIPTPNRDTGRSSFMRVYACKLFTGYVVDNGSPVEITVYLDGNGSRLIVHTARGEPKVHDTYSVDISILIAAILGVDGLPPIIKSVLFQMSQNDRLSVARVFTDIISNKTPARYRATLEEGAYIARSGAEYRDPPPVGTMIRAEPWLTLGQQVPVSQPYDDMEPIVERDEDDDGPDGPF